MPAELVEKSLVGWSLRRRVIISTIIFLMPIFGICLLYGFGDFRGNANPFIETLAKLSIWFLFFPLLLAYGVFYFLMRLDFVSIWLAILAPFIFYPTTLFLLYVGECGVSLYFRKNYVYYWLAMIIVSGLSYLLIDFYDMWIME